MREVREQEKWPVIFNMVTTLPGRRGRAAQMRNHPSVAQNLDKSQAARSEVEAVQQQWAEDAQ